MCNANKITDQREKSVYMYIYITPECQIKVVVGHFDSKIIAMGA